MNGDKTWYTYYNFIGSLPPFTHTYVLDYGNTQLTNQIASLAVTIFVSDLFRGIYS